MAVNRARVFLGGLVGGVVWVLWSYLIGYCVIGMARYNSAMAAGQFLKQPRYPFFMAQWIITLLILGLILAHLYAWARQALGAGPMTALKVGFLVGFVAGFPLNFAQATWSPIERMFPLGWMLEMWVGSILATLVAGWLYKE